MNDFKAITAAGFAATAISYGPARMGFGLYVPELKTAFDLSQGMVGAVASLGFAGFFIGLVIAQALLTRAGPRTPVMLGLIAATVGLAIVAAAPGVTTLAAGVFVAASSAGFAWTPFNDAVHRRIRDNDRPEALSEISTGTSLGIAVTGLAALGMVAADIGWRTCWAGFAIVSALALAGNAIALRRVDEPPQESTDASWATLLCARGVMLFWLAFVFGVVSAAFLSFAPDLVSVAATPALPKGAAPALVFVAFGLAGLTGLATGRVHRAIGLKWLLRIVFLAGALSLAITALWPARLYGIILGGGLQGVHVMMMSAVIAFWSERLFPSLPARSFTAALLAMAAGSIVGPGLVGLASGAFGTAPTFLVLAALPTAVALGVRGRGAQGVW